MDFGKILQNTNNKNNMYCCTKAKYVHNKDAKKEVASITNKTGSFTIESQTPVELFANRSEWFCNLNGSLIRSFCFMDFAMPQNCKQSTILQFLFIVYFSIV